MTHALLPAGLWPVMLTPYTDDGAVDWRGIDAVTDWYLDNGSAGLFANCLSSEMFHLSADERIALVSRVRSRAAGRVPVVATGNFGGSIAQQAESIRRMAGTGVQAVVVLPNMLVTAEDSDDVLKQQLDALMAATGDIPLGLYECPAPYKRVISADLTAWAAASGRFRYLKDTTCDPAAIRAKLAAARGTPLNLYNAYTGGALESLDDGAAGLSPIAANCYPELFSWLCANHREQSALAVRVQRAVRVLESAVCVQYVASAKRIMGLRGLPVGTRCRHMTLHVDHELITLHEALLETVAELCDALNLPELARPTG